MKQPTIADHTAFNCSIGLEGVFSKNNKNSKPISDSEAKKSNYYTMSDRELATLMVEKLNQSMMLELAPRSDQNVSKPLNLLRMISNYYEYNIGGIPVAVSSRNNNEPNFTVYAYIPRSYKANVKVICKSKLELVKSLMNDNLQRI